MHYHIEHAGGMNKKDRHPDAPAVDSMKERKEETYEEGQEELHTRT